MVRFTPKRIECEHDSQVLFMTGNLLKTLFAKMLSSRFHKAAHFEKLQDALRKEFLLTVMAQPRARENPAFKPESAAGSGFFGAQKSVASFMMKGRLKSVLQSGASMTWRRNAAGATAPAAADPPAAAGGPATAATSGAALAVNLATAASVSAAAAAVAADVPQQPPQAFSIQAAAAMPLAGMVATADAPAPAFSVFATPSAQAAAVEMQEQHPAGPNLAALPPHVLRTFGRANSDSSIGSSRPLLDADAAPSHAAHLQPAGSGSMFNTPTNRFSAPHSSDAPAQLPPLFERPPPRSFFQPAPRPQRAASMRSEGSRHTALSAPSRMRSVSCHSRALSNVEYREVQAEVFAALNTEADDNEIQLLAKLHQVEKHIRNNVLRLNVAERLGAGQEELSEISSEAESKRLAYYLFWNIFPLKEKETRHHIVIDDLEAFMEPELAEEAFHILDVQESGKVYPADMRTAVWDIVQGRVNLAATLKDTRTVVGKLERFMGVVIQFCFLFLYLLIWQVNLRNAWIQFSSCVVAGAFVFANSIRTIYESVIFLFVVHPFDVGDGIYIGSQTDFYIVEEIALLNTTLRRPDNSQFLYPNIQMATLGIVNLARSGNHCEYFAVVLDACTPPDIFDKLKEALRNFVEANTTDFSGAHSVNCKDCPAPLKMSISVWWEYTFNAMDRGRVFRLKSDIMRMVVTLLVEEGVGYSLPSSRIPLSAGEAYVAAGAGLRHNKPPDDKEPIPVDGSNAAMLPGMLEVMKTL